MIQRWITAIFAFLLGEVDDIWTETIEIFRRITFTPAPQNQTRGEVYARCLRRGFCWFAIASLVLLVSALAGGVWPPLRWLTTVTTIGWGYFSAVFFTVASLVGVPISILDAGIRGSVDRYKRTAIGISMTTLVATLIIMHTNPSNVGGLVPGAVIAGGLLTILIATSKRTVIRYVSYAVVTVMFVAVLWSSILPNSYNAFTGDFRGSADNTLAAVFKGERSILPSFSKAGVGIGFSAEPTNQKILVGMEFPIKPGEDNYLFETSVKGNRTEYKMEVNQPIIIRSAQPDGSLRNFRLGPGRFGWEVLSGQPAGQLRVRSEQPAILRIIDVNEN